MHPPHDEAPPLEVVGRYELIRRIGRGGMGDVFEGVHRVTGRRAAVKIARSVALDERSRQRFVREAMAAAALDHPNVVDVLDAFESDAGPVMVMELLEGETLAELMRRAGRLSLEALAPIVVPVARALVAAHDAGMVHRDLKPENIFLAMVTDTGLVPKVLDFGIVKLRVGLDAPFEDRGQATQTGAIVGTPHYMAYEQAMGLRTIDARADVWALGVIVYEALTGRRPLVFHSFAEMFEAFRTATPPPIAELADVPGDVAQVVDAMVKVRPDERLADLAPFVEVMQPHASTGTLTAALLDPDKPDPPPEAPREALQPTPTTVLPYAMTQTPVAASRTTDDGRAPRPSFGRTLVPVAAAAVLVAALAGLWVYRSAATREVIQPVHIPVELDMTSVASPAASVAPTDGPTVNTEENEEPPSAATVERSANPPTPVQVRPSPPPAPRPPPRADCDPPYTINDAGVKRFKARCL